MLLLVVLGDVAAKSAVNWVAVGTIAGVLTSFVLGIASLVKGRKADQSLETASLVQAALGGQKDLITALQADLGRHAAETNACTERCEVLRRELNDTKMALGQTQEELRQVRRDYDRRQVEIDRRDAEIGRLRLQVGEA